MRFSTSKHINDHLNLLNAQLGYKSCPRTLGTEDLMYGGTRTHDLVVEESSTLTSAYCLIANYVMAFTSISLFLKATL